MKKKSIEAGPDYELVCPCCNLVGGVTIVDSGTGEATCKHCAQIWNYEPIVRDGRVVKLVLAEDEDVVRVVQPGRDDRLECPYCRQVGQVFVQCPDTGEAYCRGCGEVWWYTCVLSFGTVVGLVEPAHQSLREADRATRQLAQAGRSGQRFQRCG